MEQGAAFLNQLYEALERRKKYLEKKSIPQLKEHFLTFQTSFKSIYDVLLRKSIINEDPYKLDKKISEITVPSKDPYAESERTEQLSIRLSDFDLQLDFISSYYDFSLSTLTMEDIKKLAELMKYITWEQVTETASNLMSRTLAHALGKLRQGTDDLSGKILNDSLNQLGKNSKQILSTLKEISQYYREEYKAEFRDRVLPNVTLNSSIVQSKLKDALKMVKQKYAVNMAGVPFYQALIVEVLNEEYGENGEELRKDLIEKIDVKEEQPKKKKQQVSFKAVLLEGMRTLAGASTHLETAVGKLSDNNEMLSNKKLSFGEKLKQWIRQVSKKGPEAKIIEIEFFESGSVAPKTEKIDFNKFIEDAKKRARVLGNFGSKMTPHYQKLEQAADEKILDFLSKNLSEIGVILKRLPGLDTYFKSEVPKEQRSMVRGIKMEINSIKSNYVKANQKKHEYISKQEEREQLKKLGIEVD